VTQANAGVRLPEQQKNTQPEQEMKKPFQVET
jgi:hypothetical protein